MQFEAQQNQFLVDQRIKAHLGQTAVFQQVGGVYNQMRPRLPILPTPMMPPMQGNMQFPGNAPFVPGMRPPVMYRPGNLYFFLRFASSCISAVGSFIASY